MNTAFVAVLHPKEKIVFHLSFTCVLVVLTWASGEGLCIRSLCCRFKGGGSVEGGREAGSKSGRM